MDNTIEIITGEATESHARLTIRLRNSEERDAKIAGKLIGPHCLNSRTLPATYPVRPIESETGTLAEVLVTEPCYWTPELPFLYQLDLEIHGHQGTIREVSGSCALRRSKHNGSDP